MLHAPVFNGDGQYCTRCNVSWDQGEPAPPDCLPSAAGVGTQPIGPPDVNFGIQVDACGRIAGIRNIHSEISCIEFVPTLEIPDTPEMAAYVEALEDYRNGRTILPPGTKFPVLHESPASDPMTGQVGGTHYSKLAIQPTEFCMRNGLDFCVGSILKYVTRHRSKNGLQDLAKARHFVEIRERFALHVIRPAHIAITMLDYVARNAIQADDAEVLYRLEAYYNADTGWGATGATRLMAALDNLIADEQRRLT